MHRIVQFTLIALTIGLLGCAEGKYPLTDEQCGPSDPVTTLDASDCVLPVN